MLPESRRVAKLLVSAPTEAEWQHAIKFENILQKNSPATARRQARLIRNRLETLDAEAWKVIAHGEGEISTQLLFAAAIQHSRLLADFLRDVYAQRVRKLEKTLNVHDWEAFVVECGHRDEQITKWTPTTMHKLYQVIVRILAEARYLDSTRKLGLTPPILHPKVRSQLKRMGATAALSCMEVMA